MNNQQKIVITGFSMLTACGQDVESTWQALQQGETGVAPITQWDASAWSYPLGAELKDYQPRKMIHDRKLLRVLSRQDVIGLNAVNQVMQHSGFAEYIDSLTDTTQVSDRTGVFAGSPGNKFNQQYDFMPLLAEAKGDMQVFADKLFEQVHPMWLLKILPNNVLAYSSMQYGFKGANENVTNHIVSGLQAIIEAQKSLQASQIDRAIVVAYEAGVEPQSQLYYGELGVLSKSGVRPFDAERDGTVMAEGAAALVLETEAAAKQRGAKIYGEVLAGTTTSEAAGIFPIQQDGDGVRRALQQILTQSQLSVDDVGMITAHGNSTQRSDAIEAQVITELFGEHTVPVTAFKWSVGHALAAAGVIETVLTLLCLRGENIPGIAPLKTLAAECEGIQVSAHAMKPRSDSALVLSRSFSSLTSCLAIRNYHD
jgi:3-oxoacyl-[acyl-carrier-protein] synthase-1